MSDEKFFFNGIDATTGEYFTPPMTGDDLMQLAVAVQEGVPEDVQADLETTAEMGGLHFGVDFEVNPRELNQAGWGVIFAIADPRAEAIRDKLQVLLDHRKAKAGDLYCEYFGTDEAEHVKTGYIPGESKAQFLAARGANTEGPVFPKRMPYYLLIVGSPEFIPFPFQYQLDIQYSVGRIDFETLDEYGFYAQSVVAAETDGVNLPKKATFFSVTHDGLDSPTESSNAEMMKPLHEALSQKAPSWDIGLTKEAAANKSALKGLLGGGETPAVLFTASHGMGFPKDHERQIDEQGALLCSEWIPHTIPDPTQYFAAADVEPDATLHGLIAFHFACFGAGTPARNDFDHVPKLQRKPELAKNSFVSKLPQRLLSHEKGGALAVIAHVDRAWGTSFSSSGVKQQLNVFDEAFRKLFRGFPVGYVMEGFNVRYAELSARLVEELQPVRTLIKLNKSVPIDRIRKVGSLWTSNNDARNYVILGDPAVRVNLQE
jgi:hypothetical protein